MAHGKTLELQAFDRQMSYRKPEPLGQGLRDRSLAGKKRVKVRKAQNKLVKQMLLARMSEQ